MHRRPELVGLLVTVVAAVGCGGGDGGEDDDTTAAPTTADPSSTTAPTAMTPVARGERLVSERGPGSIDRDDAEAMAAYIESLPAEH